MLVDRVQDDRRTEVISLRAALHTQPLLRHHRLQLGRRRRPGSNQVHGTSRVCSSSVRTQVSTRLWNVCVVPLYVRHHDRGTSRRSSLRHDKNIHRHRAHVIDAGIGSAGLVTLRAIRSARNVLIICSVSMILTIPLIVFVLMRHTGHGKTITRDFKFVAIWLFSCNTFMNSFLYIVLHRSLRRKTRLLFIDVYQLCRDG